MHYLNIINYTLNSFSLLTTCIILIISFINKLHTKFLSELMIYILIAEIINALSKYLSFFWNHCFDKPGSKRNCIMINNFGNIQIYLHLFADVLSIASNVAISLYTYNILNNKSKVLSNRRSKITIRILVFSFAIVTSIALGTIQIFYYQYYPEREHAFIEQGRCIVVTCSIAADLDCIAIGIVFGSSITTIFISFLNCRQLKRESRRLSKDKYREGKDEILAKISKAQWRIMLFPIISSALFAFYYFDFLLKYALKENFLNNKLLAEMSGLVFTFANGLRGSVCSGLVTYTLTDISDKIFKCFKVKQSKLEKQVIDQNKWI